MIFSQELYYTVGRKNVQTFLFETLESMEVKIDIMLKCYFVHAENDTNFTITSRSESQIGRMLLCSMSNTLVKSCDIHSVHLKSPQIIISSLDPQILRFCP